MCCTQGKGRGWRGPAALFMSPSASFQKVLLHRPVGSGTRQRGCAAGLIPPAVLGATAQTYNLEQPAPQPSLFWSRLYHHEQYKQPACATGICWDGERMQESKHKQQGTSTAITGINKGSTRATAERGHHIGSQSQHIKYKCC